MEFKKVLNLFLKSAFVDFPSLHNGLNNTSLISVFDIV